MARNQTMNGNEYHGMNDCRRAKAITKTAVGPLHHDKFSFMQIFGGKKAKVQFSMQTFPYWLDWFQSGIENSSGTIGSQRREASIELPKEHF